MKVRYSTVGEGRLLCKYCTKSDFYLIVERGGDRTNFKICCHCGNKIGD